MFPTDSTFRPSPKPTVAAPKLAAITTTSAKPPSAPTMSVTRFADGMLSDRLSQVEANAYKLVSLGFADPFIATGDNRGRYGARTDAAVRESRWPTASAR